MGVVGNYEVDYYYETVDAAGDESCSLGCYVLGEAAVGAEAESCP